MSPIDNKDEFVYVPVRSQRVEEVFEYMSRPRAAKSVSGAPERFASMPRDERLIALYAMCHDSHKRILEVLASRSNQWVPTQDLVEGLGLPNPRSVSGLLGSLTRVARRFGDLEPWMSRWSSPDRSTLYLMNKDDAVAIRYAQRQANESPEAASRDRGVESADRPKGDDA